MRTTSKQTPSYYLALLSLLLLAISMPDSARADCPDKPITCNTFTQGWQGTCLKGFKCKSCGPPHCPSRPLLKDMRSRAILDVPAGQRCRATIVEGRQRSREYSVCSVPDTLPKKLRDFLGMAHLIFGRSACMEHDVCYNMPGLNQGLCDDMFYDNMVKACGQYYFGHLRKKPAIRALNVLGYQHCLGVAKSFYLAVKLKGHESFSPGGGGASCKDIDAPPKLDTRMYLIGKSIIHMVSVKDKSNRPGKVKVCLYNKTKRWKGLHFKNSKTAKYQAPKKNSKSCGHYFPGEKTFFFYKKSRPYVDGYFDFRKLDLTGYAGYEVKLIWER